MYASLHFRRHADFLSPPSPPFFLDRFHAIIVFAFPRDLQGHPRRLRDPHDAAHLGHPRRRRGHHRQLSLICRGHEQRGKRARAGRAGKIWGGEG